MSIPHRNRILIPLAAASLLLLAACGNKGPLVLPQKPVPV
jgi:predicted small lipoprotein YifL